MFIQGAVWCMKFSLCGRLLATAGQDSIIRVWVLRNHLSYFNALRDRYNSHSKKISMSMGENLLQNAMQDIENDLRSSSTTVISIDYKNWCETVNFLKFFAYLLLCALLKRNYSEYTNIYKISSLILLILSVECRANFQTLMKYLNKFEVR